MSWRYYAQRAGSKEWLDTNVEFSTPILSWMLSSPDAGKAFRPNALGNPIMEDGRPLFGKWDTILLAEDETEELVWFGICTAANPVAKGTDLEFIGLTGWFAGIPYMGTFQVWQTSLYSAIRELLSAARDVSPAIPFKVTYSGGAGFYVGDPEPPAKPDSNNRGPGLTDEQWEAIKANMANHQKDWETNHGWKQQFELVWWDSPMVGTELDNLVKQYGIHYTTSIQWRNRGTLTYEVGLHIDDGTMQLRRSDIEFVDGINLARPIDVKAGTERFANRVIGLGAGEGRDMLRVSIGGNDGRLYQAEILQYKAINNQNQLRRMAEADLRFLKSDGVRVDTVTVWDMPNFASVSTLRPSDEVMVRSVNTVPPVNSYCRVVSITRDPNEAVAVVNFEVSR